MKSKQDTIRLQRLFACDDSNGDVRSLDRLGYELNQTIPVFLEIDELEKENVDPRADIKIASPPGPLAARLDEVLKPLGLTFVCRRCRIEITTEASIDENEGTTRVYDVSPLVFGVRDGLEQLTNNIEYSIDPDSWINNGGTSVISPNVIADGSVAVTTLIISAPSVCHMRIQCLLDRLNSLTSNSNYRPSGPSNGNPVNLANDNLNTPNRRRFDDRIAPKNPF